MGLDFSDMTLKEQAKLFSGNMLPDKVENFAQAYAGHQFGYFTMLGDGRAHMLGEHLLPDGHGWIFNLRGRGVHLTHDKVMDVPR